MKYFLLCLVSLFFILVSCQSKKIDKKPLTNIAVAKKYQSLKDKTILFDSIEKVSIIYKDSIASWKGYHKVKQSLEDFKSTTPNIVLNSADDFMKNVKLMRDSITVKALKTQGIDARINALYNQTLRLKDMSTISAITAEEVTKQTLGLFVIFRMIDRKINAIYEQKKFENDLLKEDFFFSKIDSIQ